MADYKLIALDMDGTLLREDKEISELNKTWIHRAEAAGMTVMMSTGRGIFSTMPYIEQLQLGSPIITSNGSEVWKAPGAIHRRELLRAEEVRELHALAVKHDTWYWAYSVEGLFNRDNWCEDVESQEWLKFGYYTEEDDTLAEVHAALKARGGLELTNSHPSNIEVNPQGVSKASAVEEVCRLLGIGMHQVVAMGDSLNDLAVIRAAGLGVAMGNAQDAVKADADLVTATNEEDGVALVIRDILEGRLA
ncbi:Cof-type HAD-IIB family hydrolase [Paenibacillus sp. y28]|uniref:Cof-type HAD-IIB family hydrolase n=1 Tax=Paenibacillus sp. y28 TaxID=3129110 RepID=UPI00301A8C43